MIIYANYLKNDAVDLIFFSRKKAQQLFSQLHFFFSQKYCSAKMREPKNQMLGTMGTPPRPPYAV